MIKIIGLKQLQKNTKKIRLEVEKGTTFVVLYRSKLLFEIRPIKSDTLPDTQDLINQDIYTGAFIKDMAEAEADIVNGDVFPFSFDSLKPITKNVQTVRNTKISKANQKNTRSKSQEQNFDKIANS